jgi:hypothetical protein
VSRIDFDVVPSVRQKGQWRDQTLESETMPANNKIEEQARVPNSEGSENGSSLPIRDTCLEDLTKRTDEELIALANGEHRKFGGCLRKAIKDHARLAGAALNEMKRRTEHGAWGAWLKENFEGSAETARLYMRVASEWDQLIAAGLDREPGVTLEQLRSFLCESNRNEGRPPPEKPPRPTLDPGPEGEDDDPGGDDEEPTAAPPPPIKMFPLFFNEEQQKEFTYRLDHLKKVYRVETDTDAVVQAVRLAYKKEQPCDQVDPPEMVPA